MGIFTINHYSRIRIEPDALRLRYVLDMAELPTLAERQDMDKNEDNDISDAEIQAYIQDRTPRWLGRLALAVDGNSDALDREGYQSALSPGVANLSTMRIEIDCIAPLNAGKHHVTYSDTNYPERPGWKEMVVVTASGLALPAGNAPNREISRGLRSYPADLLANPPQDSSADFGVDIPDVPHALKATATPKATPPVAKKPITPEPASAAPYVPWTEILGIDLTAAPKPAPVKKPHPKAAPIPPAVAAPLPSPPQQPRLGSAVPAPSWWSRVFHSLVAVRRITPLVLLTSLLIAFCLGAIHALQPGHGKTLVAAYLVGQRGTARHAVLLGLTVTLSHTFGVFLLGAVAMYGSQFILPEVLQPWMGFASGSLIALIGGGMLGSRLREIARDRAHAGGASHSHDHDHGAGTHSHGPMGEHTHAVPDSITLGSLLALGISGGIVPCPDALIVLLGAIAIHKTLYGLGLIVAFSAGLAVTLTAAGLAVVWGQRRTPLSRLTPNGVRAVSIIGNAIVLAMGFALAVQSLFAIGILTKRG